VFWLVFKINLCSAILFKRYRQVCSIDVAEHSPILKSKGVQRVLVSFQDKPMVSLMMSKWSRRALSIDVAELLNIGLS